jgi:RNA polymerase sigma-70 factor (ECF subfamily)
MVGVVVEHPEVRMARLLRGARNGDHQAFGELVKQHESMVFSIALHALRDASLAEELAQDVFLQLYRKLPVIESGAHLVFWLRRVTVNRCIDQLRRMRHLGIPMDSADVLVLTSEEDHLLHRRLRHMVATLPPKQRMAVILRYQEELEPREISSIMRTPLNTVKSHLRRALSALRLRLGVTAVPDQGAQGAEMER